jgi:hypothetical protein
VNFIEKILATTLVKLSNLIPDAGIWLNTQRPEWNDANNALVGNGVSMVTLYYLRRFLSFFTNLLADIEDKEVRISAELFNFYTSLETILENYKAYLDEGFDDSSRKAFMDDMGEAATKFRETIYSSGFSTEKKALPLKGMRNFYKRCNLYLEASIDSNERPDHLYHAYNIIGIQDDAVSVSRLDEMLEGQVAVLSSGYLTSDKVLKLLDSLRNSKLYREDQNSYILYPNKELQGFLARNQVPAELVKKSALLERLIADNNVTVIDKDPAGNYHFNGSIRNGFELDAALDKLESETYGSLVEKGRTQVQDIYEEVFNHKTFTGRSGTFYGYEGLGSIYWHMVSKLLLAVEECTLVAVNEHADESEALIRHCRDVFEGIGVHKSPEVYGAFSIDPYSHTPFTKGAQQPGMTGQVKEDIISRILELGVIVENGRLSFSSSILADTEFLERPSQFNYVDVNGTFQSIDVPENGLAFTYCQVPIVYQRGNASNIKVIFTSGVVNELDGSILNSELSEKIFRRSGEIEVITVTLTGE